MLSKEEEEAIKRLEKRIKDNEIYTLTQVWLTDDVVATNIVLKLITKLQKENEEKDRQIDLMALAILNYDVPLVISRYKDIDEVKETFKDLAKAKGE